MHLSQIKKKENSHIETLEETVVKAIADTVQFKVCSIRAKKRETSKIKSHVAYSKAE
jgi:hypothetical protein